MSCTFEFLQQKKWSLKSRCFNELHKFFESIYFSSFTCFSLCFNFSRFTCFLQEWVLGRDGREIILISFRKTMENKKKKNLHPTIDWHRTFQQDCE